jgi:hypothetical protein
MANTSRGGQYNTEFNMRSRESVGVGPPNRESQIDYMVGPSYAHGELDFYVRPQMDGIGLVVEPAVLEILPGRALVAGHFVENLAPMIVDLRAANLQQKQNPGVHGPELKGDLVIGLRAMYATELTLSGTILPENKDEMFQGIQVVILPRAGGLRTTGTFNLPHQVPKDANLVTAHLELASFSFSNGRITGVNEGQSVNPIQNNFPNKCQYIDGSRLSNIGGSMDSIYLTKLGLNPDKIYAMAGRGAQEQATWCDITANTIMWDSNPDPGKTADIVEGFVGGEAEFVANLPTFDGITKFVLPRKQIEGMQGSDGKPRYYMPKVYDLPLADFLKGTSGTVDRKYTNNVKRALRQIHTLGTLPSGKQRAYVPRLNQRVITNAWILEGALPVINNNWRPGDYVLVAEDSTLQSAADTVRPPSSLYPIVPGVVLDLEYGGATNSIDRIPMVFQQIQEATIKAEPNSRFTGALGGTTTPASPHTHKFDPQVEAGLKDDIKHAHSLMYEEQGKEHTHNLDTMAIQVGSQNFTGTIVARNEPFIGTELARVVQNGFPPISHEAPDKELIRDMFGIPNPDDLICPTCSAEAGYLQGIIGQDYVIYEDSDVPFPQDVEMVQAVRMLADRLTLRNLEIGDRVAVAQDNKVYRLNTLPTGYNGTQDTVASNWQEVSGLTRPQALGLRYHWYRVSVSGPNLYAQEPILVTGEIGLATEMKVGGFLNVQDTYLDQGYVRMNDEGHLQLVDYGLLRSGVLAYQLGEDFHTPNGIITDEVQGYLNEFVNRRVAFPNWNQEQYADDPNIIHIYINLPEDDPGEINIFDIDSRFNSSIFIHINGLAGSDTIINISDCAKVRIDPNICGGSSRGPIVNLYRSNLYYDAQVLNRLNIISDLSLWYERFDELDPDLVIDGMRVREVGNPILPQGTKEFNFWNIEQPNDNHFQSALRSLTFGKDGTIIGWEVLVKNDSTVNILRGNSTMRVTKVFSFPFSIPQGSGLTYPTTRVTKPLKVTGNFVNAYKAQTGDSNSSYIVLNTSFTILSQVYNSSEESDNITGTISFFQDAMEVDSKDVTHIGSPIAGWDTGEFHIFSGGSMQ